jgi:uncharacterized membrane protein YbhN (UPF0104 family)
MKKWIGWILKTVLPLILGAYLVWYFFDRMTSADKAIFYQAIRKADYLWVILSLILSFGALLSRAYRWKYVLEPLGYKTRFWNRYHALMIGYIVNLTIPRAGEASRAMMLYRSDGVPFSKSFGTILAERAVDLVMLGLVLLLTISIGHSDFWQIKEHVEHYFEGGKTASGNEWGTVVLVALGVLAFGGLVLILVLRKLREKLIGFIKDVFAGIFAVFRSAHPFSYAGHTFLIWVLYVTYFAICFFSLEETSSIPFAGILIAFIAGSLGISFTNGGIGSFPLLVGLVLGFYLGEKHDVAATAIGSALGMIIWASQTIMVIILGLISLVLLPKNYTAKERTDNELPV